MSETETDANQAKCVTCRRGFDTRLTGKRFACPRCETRMRNRLIDVLEYYALAEHELVPGSGSDGRGTEPALGVRVTALDFLAGHDAVAVLASWESEWREHYGLSIQPMLGRPGPALSRSVAFLCAWLNRACTDHPAIDEFDRELHECWSEARTAARMSPPKTMTITCVADVEVTDEDGEQAIETCGRRIPVSADDISGRVQCRGCRTTWDVLHLIHVAISTPGAELWADPEAAAGYFRIHEGTLRKWAKADRIRREHGRYELHSIYVAIHEPQANVG